MKISFAKNHRKVLAPLIAASILTASLTLTMTSTFAVDLFSGGIGSETEPYQISTAEDLAKLAKDVNSGTTYADTYFEITQDIDLTSYLSEAGEGYQNGKGWEPIGNKTTAFSGKIDGKGHLISGLWSNRPAATEGNDADADNEYIGLFGRISSATIANIEVEIDNSNVGSSAEPAPTTGLGLMGSARVGGIVGAAEGGADCIIQNCTVSAVNQEQPAVQSNRQVTSNYAYTGGLIGESKAAVTGCSAAVSVSGTHKAIGGFVGFVGANGTVSLSCASGDVSTGQGSAGGFVGRIADNGCKIENCYSTGNVSAVGGANNGVGGFVGEFQEQYSKAIITNCYSTGQVKGYREGDTKVFGFCGYVHAPYELAAPYGIYDSFFLQDEEINTGLKASANGHEGNTYYSNIVGIAEESITAAETFANWDPTIWYLADGRFPTFIVNVTVTPKAGQTKVYDGNAFDPAELEFDIAGAPDGFELKGTASFEGEVKDKGTYTILQGTIDNEHNPGYNIIFTQGVTFSVTGIQITVTPKTNQSKTYGEAKTIEYDVTGTLSGDASFEGALALSSEDVGTQKITQGTLKLTGDDADNYSLIFTEDISYTVNRKTVTITPDEGQKKSFDGKTASGITYKAEGLVGEDQLTGALALENDAADAGKHVIVQGTLTDANNPNYSIQLSGQTEYEIESAEIIVKPISGLGKDYDGKTVELTGEEYYSFTVDGEEKALVDGYSLEVVLGLKDDALEIGTHDIIAKTLKVKGDNPDNYTIALSEETVTYQIAEVAISILPDADQNIVYGSDTPITYTTEPADLPAGLTLKGELALSGSAVGKHAIEIGTLELEGENAYNYRLVLADGVQITVTAKAITVTPDAGQSKEYDGETVSGITYKAEGLVGEDQLTGALALENDAADAGKHKIVLGTLANPNYTITVTEETYEIIAKDADEDKDGDVTEDPNQEDDGLDNDNTDSAADNDNTEANDDVTQTGVPAATMIMILFAVSFTAILIFKKKRAA